MAGARQDGIRGGDVVGDSRSGGDVHSVMKPACRNALVAASLFVGLPTHAADLLPATRTPASVGDIFARLVLRPIAILTDVNPN